jgi:exopolysaccharide production protein ExoQ
MRPDENTSALGRFRIARIGIEEIACVLLLAFFAMQGAIPGIAPNQANEMTNTAATGLMKIAGIGSQVIADGAICLLALTHLQRLWRFAFALQWTAALAALALCSTLWSQDAMTTARRSIPFVLATLFGLYFASRFSVQKQLSILTTTMVLATFASIALALFFPSIGLEASTGHFGNWQGVFTQKNACGRAMVFATAALLSNKRMNARRCACMLLFLFVLVMSGSRGAWIIEGVLFACYGIVRAVERFTPLSRKLLLAGTFVAALTAAAGAWLYFPQLAGELGRDASLSGRTAIWQQVWAAIEKRPLLGYGFAAFWQGLKGESYTVIVALRFVIFHAHNGFLEIWLELGAAGLLLFTLSYARAWRKLWPLLWSKRLSHAFWMIFVLLLVALYDIDENTLFTFNGIFWILYVAVLADVEILALEHRQARFHWSRQTSETTRLPASAAS